jgi:hypothetical protein
MPTLEGEPYDQQPQILLSQSCVRQFAETSEKETFTVEESKEEQNIRNIY